MRNGSKPVRHLLRRFVRDRHAVAAVEFALIAPIMVLLLLASFDITRAIEAKTKVTTLARTINDFITQGQSVTPTELATIFEASKTIMHPYPISPDLLKIHVESIVKKSEVYKVDWSYAPQNSTDRPTTITPADNAVVKTDVTYEHELKFGTYMLKRFGWDRITLNASSMMSSRWGQAVEAKDF